MLNFTHWTAGLHHDGSSVYVSNPLPRAGEVVTVRLRVPLDAPIKSIALRTAPDGENQYTLMQQVRTDSVSAFWEAELPVTMPLNNYRFKILSHEGAYYLNALGVSRAEPPDVYDFKLLADYQAPLWVREAVFYQIFPDRFMNGDPANDVSAGAWERRGFATTRAVWGEPPAPWREKGSLDFYGGDLDGITQKMDYLADLGITALYLNPIFAAQSNHRYDILDFLRVDPHLGGDEALIRLRQALHERGMKLMLDTTPNHLSWQHPWFKAAQRDMKGPTAEFFTFFDDDPNRYECWAGVPSLPKLNYTSQKIREKMYRADDSALRYWLRGPFAIDGWRLDVLNMVARQGMSQLGHEVGREMRAAVKAENPDAYLLGEHVYDGTSHLQGDELDATMNYQGFNIPLRRWLCGYDVGMDWNKPSEVLDSSPLPGEAMAEQWQHYLAAIPYVIALQQFNQLDNHDTMRMLTAVNEDKALLRLGAVLLMTYVGVPCLYYGDEIGLAGGKDPDNRRCMPWDDTEWDSDLRAYFKQLIYLHRTSPALQHGGYQLLYASGDVVAFQRHAPEERLIVVGYRGEPPLTDFALSVHHGGWADGVGLEDVLSHQAFQVRDGYIHIPELVHGQAMILREQP